MCDINDDLFEFKVNSETPIISGEKCEYFDDKVTRFGALNEVIFRWTNTKESRGSLNSIEGTIFRHFKIFSQITLSSNNLRKINHKQGIEWIRNLNYGVKVNLSNLRKNDTAVVIILTTLLNKQKKKTFGDNLFR